MLPPSMRSHPAEMEIVAAELIPTLVPAKKLPTKDGKLCVWVTVKVFIVLAVYLKERR
jgi:hypothetical protein